MLKTEYPAGGDVSYFYILTYDSLGALINSESICNRSLDLGGGNNCEINLIRDSLLEINSWDVMNSEHGMKSNYSNYKYNYLLINENGFREVKVGVPSKGRKYPQASIRVLSKKELMKMSLADLDIMRNEIFADHGYIFKTQKWSNYFKNKSWYKPRYQNVNSKLTLIERINVERIVKVSHLKKHHK